MMQNLKENWFVVSKMTRIWRILIWALEILVISTLIGSFYAKCIMFDLKKYRGVSFHDNEKECKIWRISDFWFEKWHEEYGKFSPEHLKVSKLGLWWDPLIPSRKCMSFKFTEEISVMTVKNNAKFGEEQTCRFKIGMRNLTMGSFFEPKYILVELKEYRGVIFHETDKWCKIWRGIDLSFQNWHEEFDKF